MTTLYLKDLKGPIKDLPPGTEVVSTPFVIFVRREEDHIYVERVLYCESDDHKPPEIGEQSMAEYLNEMDTAMGQEFPPGLHLVQQVTEVGGWVTGDFAYEWDVYLRYVEHDDELAWG